MANLDSRFFCTSDLDTYYVDNASGLPMSGGIVTFYSDVNRTELKPVYQLTGTPGNYTYSPLPNPCTLSSSGTFQDALGNNIVPYYYPFTGVPEDNTGVQELYYITCINSGFVPQFIRQGWPQAAGNGSGPSNDNEIDNYIPNGQFLSHNNIVSITEPPITQYSFGSETVDSQAIAQGGWNFVYTDANTAIFNNSFSQIPSSGGWGINSFPKFAFNFVCSEYNSNALTRDLRIQWPDINKFSSGNPPGTTNYTLFFDAKSNDGNTYVFTLYQIYYFGTGGSPSSPMVNEVATITVGPSETFTSYNINNINFAANQGTIGTNGDDYIALSIRGPASAWNAAFTDFLLTQGNETFTSFPVQTNDQMLSRGVAGWMPTPNPNGQDLYLPLILTPQGMVFDHTGIGEIVSTTNPSINSSSISSQWLLCDGSSYITSQYSAIGIPYSRLFNVYLNNGYSVLTNIPLYGTGINYATSYISSGNTANIRLTVNNSGIPIAAAADGNTGWTFSSVHIGSSTINFTSNAGGNTANEIENIGNFITPNNSNSSNAGTSPFTVSDNNLYTGITTEFAYSFSVITTAASSITGGEYFTFSNSSTDYYMWFKINGSGSDPAPGGTGIQVNLLSSYSASDVAMCIQDAMNMYQSSSIVVSGLPSASQYWTFQTNPGSSVRNFYVWYTVNNIGTDPKVSGSTGINVMLTGSENAAEVASKTQLAINSYQFAVPNMQGMFLRALDPNGYFDLDGSYRWSKIAGFSGVNLGTYEYQQFLGHQHQILLNGQNGTPTGGQGPWLLNQGPRNENPFTEVTGGSETRPVNAAVNFFVRY